jgi:hypothetical protein
MLAGVGLLMKSGSLTRPALYAASMFLGDLEARSLVAEPVRIQRDTAVRWNRAAAKVSGWPPNRCRSSDNRGHYAMPWATFPASLKQDVDAWIHWLSSTDLSLDRDFVPLRSTSIRLRTRQIHEYLSALVHQGEEPALLASLPAAVVPARAAKGLTFFFDRAGGKPVCTAAKSPSC